jgi:hypothetical protein
MGSTQPLTEMSTRNLSGCKGRPVRKADNLTAICEPTVKEIWKPLLITTYGPPRPVIGLALLFYVRYRCIESMSGMILEFP